MNDGADGEQWREWAGEANRAPSIHNVQPGRWGFAGGVGAGGKTRIQLYGDPARWLPVSDPSGHDDRLSLGAAFEGMALALSRRGRGLALRELNGAVGAGPRGPELVPVALAELGGPVAEDPLAAQVLKRACWRGNFTVPGVEELAGLKAALARGGDAVWAEGAEELRFLGRLTDEASLSFLREPDYFRELRAWMRFSPRERGWDQDGLNAVAMALSGPERVIASFLMSPGVFAFLVRLGLAGAVITEAPKIRSASGVVIFTAAAGEDPFLSGRRFYRLWLEICASGFSLCPMSALADSPVSNQKLRERYGIAADRRIVNALRVGKAPASVQGRLTVRRDPRELLV